MPRGDYRRREKKKPKKRGKTGPVASALVRPPVVEVVKKKRGSEDKEGP